MAADVLIPNKYIDNIGGKDYKIYFKWADVWSISQVSDYIMLRCRKFGAFTLVELLVVIAIIALLMAILVPALQSARGQARKIVCMSNMRNFSMAHKQYQAETNTYLSHTQNNPYTPWYNNDYFRTVLGLPRLTIEQKERRTGQIQEWQPNAPRNFICPAATYALSHAEDGFYSIDRSYGVNIDGDALAKKRGVSNLADKESWVKQPSTKLFMADALDWWVSYHFCHLYLEHGEKWVGFDTYGMTAFRHSDGLNVMYWDGHCGRLRTEEVIDNPRLWDPLD
ncbi:MAG: type II secretion system protein [Planctomycetota bacterium]|jgi:prepilin-type N-terminal cleavage/methylation domain-containing protein/prepilin-type processing-associated H-X9-DG protein